MVNDRNISDSEQLEIIGELLRSEHEGARRAEEISEEQSLMAIEIIRKLGRGSVAGFNPKTMLRKELRIPRDDEKRAELFKETFERLCEVRLVRVYKPRKDEPKSARSAKLTWLGGGVYGKIFGRTAPVEQPQNH